MRFEKAYTGWQKRRLTQEAAAELLGVCARTFRRHINRFENEGIDGLLDKRMHQVSAQCAPLAAGHGATEGAPQAVAVWAFPPHSGVVQIAVECRRTV